MEEFNQQQSDQSSQLKDQHPVEKDKPTFLKQRRLLALLIAFFFIVSLLFAYWLGKRNIASVTTKQENVDSQVSLTPQSSNDRTYTDDSSVYSLKLPKDFVPNVLSSDVTDSCVVFADYTFVQPNATEEEMVALRKKGTLIHACYTAKELENITNSLNTSEANYAVTSSTPFTINGYRGFKLNATSSSGVVNDVVVIKSPYEGYIVFSRETNGEAVYNNMLSSFTFIKPKNTVFTTADQEAIRKLFADQYKKDITVTFNYPSPNQNSVSGGAYLPEGAKCFNADRSSSGWTISYTGTSMTDSKCYSFEPSK